MINRATLLAAFLFIIAAVLGKASAADLPTYTADWASTLPYPVPSADDFVVSVRDTPTTATLGAASIPLNVDVEFRGGGIVWQVRAETGGQFVIECLANSDGMTSGPLSVDRAHRDGPCLDCGTESVRDGLVFSSKEYPPEMARHDYIHSFVPRVTGGEPCVPTAELIARLAEIYTDLLEREARNYMFVGSNLRRTLDLTNFVEPWKAGTYRLRIGIYVYPSCVPPAKRTLIATREIAWSEPFDLIVEPGAWGATLGGPGATDVEPRN